jgi:hypothetical protein
MQAVGGVWIAWGSGDRDRRWWTSAAASACRRRIPILHAAAALAQPAGHPPVLLRLRQPVSLAALPPAAGADADRAALLGAVRGGQRPVRRRRARRADDGGGGAPSGSRTTTWRWRPPCAAAAAGLHPRALLAHPVSAARDLPRRERRAGAAARPARQRPPRLPPPAVLRQLPALRGIGAARRARGLGAARRDVDGHTCYVRAFPISIDVDSVPRGRGRRRVRRSACGGCARATRPGGVRWVSAWTASTTRRGSRRS